MFTKVGPIVAFEDLFEYSFKAATLVSSDRPNSDTTDDSSKKVFNYDPARFIAFSVKSCIFVCPYSKGFIKLLKEAGYSESKTFTLPMIVENWRSDDEVLIWSEFTKRGKLLDRKVRSKTPSMDS